jgi:crotonobetainyl-CoA:carnitine CoA-transferase CaiB-like acyl-CoA transferase
MSEDTRPFVGIRVIDCTHVLAGPFAAYQLAVLGADVIKVEHPADCDQSRNDGFDRELSRRHMGTAFLTQASNKRSLTLDLKAEEGRDILRRLIPSADVFVENYRSGAMAALGLGYEDLSALNPRLIYCSMTAFGQSGPRAQQTAYDHVIQSLSGLMACTGTADSAPTKAGAQVIDYASGTMCAFALASALFQRERSGKGQHIDSAMLDVALMLLGAHVTGYTRTGKAPRAQGNDHKYAGNSFYSCEEGRVMLGGSNPAQHRRLCHALGRADLANQDGNEYREDHWEEQRRELEPILRSRTATQWETFLQERHVPAGRLRTLEECLEDEQLAHREVLHRHDGASGVEGPFTVPKAAFKLAHGGPRIDTPPPALGEHTDEILAELGLGRAETDALRARRIV